MQKNLAFFRFHFKKKPQKKWAYLKTPKSWKQEYPNRETANPGIWSLAVVKFVNTKGKVQPITALPRAPIKTDSLPPPTKITQPIQAVLIPEEIADAHDQNSMLSPATTCLLPLYLKTQPHIPETVLSYSSPISPITWPLLKRARKRKACTLSVPKKRTKK